MPTAAAAAALLLALVPMIQTPLSIPALPYDVILLFISGTAAPTQETTLSAPSSAWYSNAGATGLLMQPAFRHFLSNTTYADDLEIRTVLWLGPIGAGPIELEYGSELATSISVFDGITVEKVTRMQGLPQSGVGSSLGRWIRSQSNATWTTPFLGPLWDQREAKLQASMGGLGTGTERIRFIHAYTKGAADRTNWDDAPTLGSLDAFGTFLVSAVSDPAKFEAQADHATDYKDYSYYPFAGSIVSWSPVGSYIFAVVDFLLATGSMVWAGHRRYATAEGSPWTIEARAWLWTFLLWIAGLCVVGVLLPTGIWWAVTSSGASLKLYLSLGLPSMIPSPSLPLLSASVMLAWSAVSTGESTVPALHVAGIWLMALINLVLTAVMPSANWVLSWTVFFGLFFGVLEFWCEEYGRWLIKVEDLEHYDEMLEEFTLWEDEQEFAEKLNGEMVEDWYAVMDDGIGGPPDGHSASFGRSQSPGGRHRSGVMFDASANRGRSGFVNATGTRARSTFIDATAADHLSELLDATAARAQSNYLEVTTARARMLESILHPEAPLWDSAVASAPSDALGTPGRDDTRPRSRTEAMDSSRGRTRSLSRRRSANFGAHAHASPSFASAERHLSQRNQTHLGVPHARRAAAETWNTPMYADIDTLGGAMALSDIVDDMMQNGGSFDAEEIEDEGPSILERSNAEVYRLFYTPHLYHHPTTFFLVLRAVFLPFMAFAPIWAAVTATETSTAQMSSWANDVTGVPWVAVIPSVVTALAVTSVTPLWAMWSENRVTSRGVEKDWWWVRWLVPVALFVAFLGTFIAGYTRAAQFQNGGSFPVPTTIGYFLDTSLPFGSSGSALFYTVDETAYTPFSLQFLGYALAADEYHWIPMPIYLDYGRSPTGIRQKGRQSIQSNAALWSLVPPEAAVLSDLYTNGTNQRDIVLQITSPRGAVNFAVQVVAPANVLSLRVWGANVDLSKPPAPYVNSSSTGAFNRFHVECVPCPPDGVRIGMTLVASDSNLTITVKTSETSWGLPYKDSSTAFPPFQWDDRPLGKEIMGSWWGMADPTVVYAQNLLFSKFNTSGLENGTLTTVSASTTLASTGTVSSVKTTVASTKSTVKSSSSTRRTTKKVNKRHYQ